MQGINDHGADRISITGVNAGRPSSTPSQDGYEWRVNHTARGLDSYPSGDHDRQVIPSFLTQLGNASRGLGGLRGTTNPA